ncbi:MAG: hypothetical protein WC655_27655 [Candidatus Hydrogenedentales bacterium]
MHSLRVAVVGVLVVLGGISAGAEDPNPPSIHGDGGAWPVVRQWTVPETHHFAQWINHIYKLKCQGTVEQRRAKIERVLTDPEMNLLLDEAFAGEQANPQLDVSIMRSINGVIDCGKLTVTLSSYYAYRRGLPWMISYVRSTGGDLRTASHNIPVGTYSSLDAESPQVFFSNAVTGYCTGNLRVEPFNENSELSDTVPVAINPQYLLPGCMHYLDGHVLILAEVDRFGELHFLDSTTAASRDIYSFNGLNAVMGIPAKRSSQPGNEYAGCFQGLRVWRYPIAETDDEGKVTKVRRRTDAEMAEFGFSTEQYDRIEEISRTQRIVESGIELTSFHEFIQARMRKPGERVAPAVFLRDYADQLLNLFAMREEIVQEGWKDVLANGAITFPENSRSENIFTAGGRWGEYSTASSDIDIRARYYYLADWMDNVVRWYDRQPDLVDLTGLEWYYTAAREDLAHSLVGEKNRVFAEKVFQYTNSAGEKVSVSLLELERRLYDMSFDPNHSPELRWGAPTDSPEFATAKETATPLPDGNELPMMEAYQREAFYRAVGQKETTESYLQEMFTKGFPKRDKFDLQLAKWLPDKFSVPPLMPSKRPEPPAKPVAAPAKKSSKSTKSAKSSFSAQPGSRLNRTN